MKMFKWLAGACVLAVSGLTYAQADYPNKPVKLVVGYATGGPTEDRKSTRLNSSH